MTLLNKLFAAALLAFAAAGEASEGKPALASATPAAAQLRAAAARGDAAAVARLLAAGAAADATDERGFAPLHLAMGCEDDDPFAAAAGAASAAASGGGGSGSSGALAVVRALLSAGANASAANGAGVPPLAAACAAGREDVALLLLAHGADASPANFSLRNLTIAEVCAASGFAEAAAAIAAAAAAAAPPAASALSPQQREAAACLALAERLVWSRSWARGGSCERIVLQALGDGRPAGAGGVDCADEHGRTPLHFAIANEQVAAALAIIKRAKKQTLNAVDAAGHTPLLLAVLTNEVEVVRALLRRKANAFAKNADGRTARDVARARIAGGLTGAGGEGASSGGKAFSAAIEMAALFDTAERGGEL